MIGIPTSFDFGGAIRPDFVVKTSYGNDSIALIQFLHEYNQKHPLGKVVCLYNDTGWAAKWWEGRVRNAEKNLVQKYGFIPCRTESIGMKELIRRKKSWPRQQTRFCTQLLKIIPTLSWLCVHDPDAQAEMVCGVRREESKERALWPEHLSGDRSSEGRDQWSPLAFVKEQERNDLIIRAGWVPLETRSKECRCILDNAAGIRKMTADDLSDIRSMEAFAGTLTNPPNSLMFDPSEKRGRPHGIMAVYEWAKTVKTKEKPAGGCDSGYCTG